MGLKYDKDNVLDVGRTPRQNERKRMPYAAGHRLAVKKRIIDSARLTHGGFYSYFKSKSDLYAEVLDCFFTNPEWEHCWEGVEVDLSKGEVGPQIVRAYLSRQHFEDVENSCQMVALPTDVAHSGVSARTAFETVFRSMVSVLERSIRRCGKHRHTTAQATAAMCIGGMVIARAIVNREVVDDLRKACMVVALELGGWDEDDRAAKRKS
jgi:AcrR family transcriptional regulator